MQPIHLIIGVPGSGKTHICKQLEKDYCWVKHDQYPVGYYYKAIAQAAKYGDMPVLAECPFRATVLIEQLEKLAGCKVLKYYLVEDLKMTRERYETRTGKAFPQMHMTNYKKYRDRFPQYTQESLLKELSKPIA